MIPITVWFRHMELDGSTEKHVTCEHCQHAFHYQYSARVCYDVPLFPGSKALLTRTCQRQLAKRLQQDVEPMSCPECGWIQSAMTRALRQQFLRKIRTAGQCVFWGMLCIIAIFGIGGMWVWFNAIPMNNIDFDGWGATLACLAGAGFGLLLIGFRILCAKLRYPKAGFMPKNPILPRDAAFELNQPDLQTV